MTTFWPKRDKDGRHVSDNTEGDVRIDNEGRKYVVGHVGPELYFKATHGNTEKAKPLSELLAKLDPDVVERARADVAVELESGKLSYDCIYCCDTGISIDEYGEEITCGCTE